MPRNIVSVQVLRAVAAMSVAIVHFDSIRLMLMGDLKATTPLYSMASGVDIFFVISGFIMVHSSRDLFMRPGGARIFLLRRFSRIVPIYWLTTILSLYLMSTPFHAIDLVQSFLFIPYVRPDGAMAPLHGVGWSLNFEAFFYVVFGIFLRLGRVPCVLTVSFLFVLCVVSARYFPPTWAALIFWSDPIILEFVLGMVIALAYQKSVVLSDQLRLILMAGALAAFWFSAPHMPPSGLRVLYWGVPAAILMAAVVLGRHEEETGPTARFAKLIGDASYSIYLIHPLVGAVVFVLWPLGLNRYPLTTVMVLCGIATLVIAVPTYCYGERRVTQWLHRMLLPDRPAAGPAGRVDGGTIGIG